MNRGAVYWVNLEDTHPPEFGKKRPALIVSNSEQNQILPTVVVLPISSRKPEIWPLRLEVVLGKGRSSYVVIPGIRQVAKTRLLECIAVLPEMIMNRVSEAVELYLQD